MIRSFLDASSGHLSPETWTWLDEAFADGPLRDPKSRQAGAIAGGRTRYGWFVYSPEDPDDDLPSDLRAVLQVARQQGAEYVLFDCDAALLTGMPVLHPDFAD